MHYTLQYTATRCNTLHHTALHCNTLQPSVLNHGACGYTAYSDALHDIAPYCTQHAATRCTTLQQYVTHCNTLHHAATLFKLCNTLQHSASESARVWVVVLEFEHAPPFALGLLQCFVLFCCGLQCVAMCCSVLQCVAVCCSEL